MGLVDRNPRTVLAVAFVASAALLGGAATAFVTAGGDGSTSATNPVVTPGPTALTAPPLLVEPTPVISVAPSPTASPSASAAESASPAASPTASASAKPRATATATATGTPTRFPYPSPSQQYAGLVLSATLNPGSGTTATTFDLQMKATDGDGKIYFDGLVWGDGTSVRGQGSPQKCGTFPPLTSPAGAYEPSPDSETYRYQHRYARSGTYRITANVSSVNEDCKPNGPAKETRTVVFDVKVSAAPAASATPSPTASPAASATPAASPAP